MQSVAMLLQNRWTGRILNFKYEENKEYQEKYDTQEKQKNEKQ